MSKLRILHVDDDETITNAARDILTPFELVSATTLDEARRILSGDAHFDAVIVDRELVSGNPYGGDLLVRWIRGRQALRHLCVVMLTSHGSASAAVDALRAGAWQFLDKRQKAVDLRELLLVGVVWKRCHRVRNDLLSIATRQELLDRVTAIITLLGPVAPHMEFFRPADEAPHDTGRRAFVERVREGEAVLVSGADDMMAQQPFSTTTRSLLAVPIRGEDGWIIGVLSVESTREAAFPPYWFDLLTYMADMIGVSVLAIEAGERRLQLQQNELAAEKARYAQLELVYHELRHMIASHAQTISLNVPKLADPAAATGERLRVIQRNAEAIEAAVRGLRDATDELPLDRQLVDLAVILAEAVEDISRKLPDEIEIDVDCLESVPCVADRHWIRECFLCILQNAVEAIGERRRQDLDYVDGRSETIAVAVRQAADGITIAFRDQGIGFSPDDAERLFQPLFSTKTKFPEGGRQETLGVDRLARMLDISRQHVESADFTKKEAIRAKKGFEMIIRDLGPHGQGALATISTEIRHGGDESIRWDDQLLGDVRRGVGLHTVRRVVQGHDGTVRARSEGPFTGAEFVIHLHS